MWNRVLLATPKPLLIMNRISPSQPSRPGLLAWIGLALLAYTPALAAQATAANPGVLESSSLPGSLLASLATIALCGAVGAFAADLVTDGGRLDRWRADANGWALGFLAKLVVGAVAALILQTLNPPGGSWLTLIGTALAAGVGGEALLLAIIAGRKADQAEAAARSAGERERRTLARTGATLRSVRDRLATQAGDAGDSFEKTGLEFRARAEASTPALATVEDALSAMAAEARGSVVDTVKAILERVLNRKDVDKRKLKDIGGDEPHRQMIAMDIAATWDGMLSRPFTDSDVSGDDTLATLAKKVRDLLV